MKEESVKYNKVLNILRKSKPELYSTEDIEREVIKRISKVNQSGLNLSELIDFLFSWIYIGWVRRSLVTASVFLVIIFVFQQSIMMKQITHLSRQIESYERDASGVPGEYPDRRMMLLRFSGKRFPFIKKANSDKQLKELFRAIDQLKKEYKKLDSMIKEDPELKKLIEKKLSEIDGNKIKL